MQKTVIFLSLIQLLATTSTTLASDDTSFELVDGLTACSAKIDVARETAEPLDDLMSIRVSVNGALKYLLGGGGLTSDRRRLIDDLRNDYSAELQTNPMTARRTLQTMISDCRELVYQAEDVRVERAETAKRDAEIKTRLDAEIKLKEADAARLAAEAAKQASIAEDRATTLALAKVKADVDKLQITKGAEIQSQQQLVGLENTKIEAHVSLEKAKLQTGTDQLQITKGADVEVHRATAGVEIAKANATASVEKSKVEAEVARYNTDKNVEADIERTKAGVALAKVKGDGDTALAAKLVDLAKAREAALTDRARVSATAEIEVAKANASAAGQIAGAAAEISKYDAAAAEAAAELVKASNDGLTGVSSVAEHALECGGFYEAIIDLAPVEQRQGVLGLTQRMFDIARREGADEAMVTNAPLLVSEQIKSVAAAGKQKLKAHLITLKQRCAEFQITTENQ